MSDHCDFCFAYGGEWAHGVWMCAHCEWVLVTKVKIVEDRVKVLDLNRLNVKHLKVVINGETIHEYRDES